MNEQTGQLTISQINDPAPVKPVVVENPSSRQQRSSFVPLGETLGPGDSKCDRCSRRDGIVDVLYRSDGRFHAIEIVRLVEGVLTTPDSLVYLGWRVEGRLPQ
jgi:hypothetical protein